MEINGQLFKDVLSGKLKGTFVLRNGITVNSNKLIRTGGSYQAYAFEGMSYIFDCNGETPILGCSIVDFIPCTIAIDPEVYSYNEKDTQFTEHFINDYYMKENELTIEIPNGKIVDWDESKKQNKIVLKDKQLTYEDVCKKLLGHNFYFIDDDGSITGGTCGYTPNCAKTEHQLECILAKNKLATVAKYLNNGWKPLHDNTIVLLIETKTGVLPYEVINGSCASDCGSIWFKSKDLARQAIEILGEETVKLALEPLGI